MTQRLKQYGALLFLDLDNFKTLNDTHGHHVGDLLLKEVASRLIQNLRASDTVARFGGDEFVILINHLGDTEEHAREEVHKVASNLLLVLHKPYHLGTFNSGLTHVCSVSIGGVLFHDRKKSIDDILKIADNAMYDVKQKGKNGVKIV